MAAATFIGSMGNIPLATVLNANGVLFTGIMGFIYSDLMVPPLVSINARYYGLRVALAIAGVMFVSIVVTALVMDGAFAALGLTPHSAKQVAETTRFALDYTFWLNLVFAGATVVLAWLARRHRQARGGGDMAGMDHGGIGLKRVLALAAAGIVAVGLVVGFAVGA